MIRLSGRFRSSLIIGIQGIRARKLRTVLSMVSLFLGVLAVVVVQGGSEVAERAVLVDMEMNRGKDGTLLMSLPPGAQTIPVTLDALRGRTDAVATMSARAVIGEPGVRPVNEGGYSFDGPGEGPYMVCDTRGVCMNNPQGEESGGTPRGKAIELNVVAVTGDIRQFRPFRPEAGQWLDFASAPSLSPRLVLNREAAKGFARHRVPAEMRIDGATASPTPQIIGVVNDGADYQATAYVRVDELLNWLPPTALGSDERSGRGMEVLLSPGASDLAHTLRARLVAAGTTGAQGLEPSPINSREDFETQLLIMRLIFLGMAGLVLLIGVAGILNVGLATVGERVEEFALRRAVGTPRSLLAGIVLAETLLTGLFTSAAAIGFAALAFKAVTAIFGPSEPFLQEITFPWGAAVAGVIAGLLGGLLGGFIPAIRAAGIPIATVMRA